MIEEQKPSYDIGDVIAERFTLKTCLLVDEIREIWIADERKPGTPHESATLIEIPSLQFSAIPDCSAAFEQRNAMCEQFHHPNVETYSSFGMDRNRNIPYLTMTAMKGQSLADLLQSSTSNALPEDLAWDVISQAGAAISHIHQRGYVHSDLKPSKLFIERDGTVKLIDFMLARRFLPMQAPEQFEPADLGALTPTYASVEMFLGEDPDPRDDLYAFAIVVYQVLAGRHPYDRVSAPKAEELDLAPRAVSRLSRRQNRVLARALKFRRDNRFNTVEQFVTKLRPKNALIETLHP